MPSRTRPGERDVLWADRGWDHLPGSVGAERRLIDAMMVRADAVGGGMRQVVLADLAQRGADFARAAAASAGPKQTVYIAAPDIHAVAQQAHAANLGIDLGRFALALDHGRIRHIFTEHGNATAEAARGQRAVTAQDFADLPMALSQVLGVKVGTPPNSGSGARLIEVTARLGTETWIVVLEVWAKKGLAVPYTMYNKL